MTSNVSFDAFKPFIAVSLHPDFCCIIEVEGNCIQAMASRELVQPLTLEAFGRREDFIEKYLGLFQDLFHKIGGKGKNVGIALNTDMVFLKKIPLALGLENEMIKDQLLWEAEQFFLSPIDRFVVDYQRLPFQTQSGNPYYVFVAVRKKVVAAFQSILEKIGLVLKDVDVDLFSSVRSVLANYPVGIDDLLLLLDIQRNAVTFSFVRQKEFFLAHRAIMKTGEPSDGEDTDEILGQWLMKELRRLIFGHRLCRDIEDIRKIFLTGSDGVRRMKTILETRVSIPVEIINPFLQLQKSPLVLQSQDYSQCPEKYTASVGVALKQLPNLAGLEGRTER